MVLVAGCWPSAVNKVNAPVQDFQPGHSFVDEHGRPAQTSFKESSQHSTKGLAGRLRHIFEPAARMEVGLSPAINCNQKIQLNRLEIWFMLACLLPFKLEIGSTRHLQPCLRCHLHRTGHTMQVKQNLNILTRTPTVGGRQNQPLHRCNKSPPPKVQCW